MEPAFQQRQEEADWAMLWKPIIHATGLILCPWLAVAGLGQAGERLTVGKGADETRTLMDFSGAASEPRWQAINDGVMGGESEGGPTISEGILDFRGSISLANNGGFSSIRARGKPYDLSEAANLLLRVNGDGRTYQIRLYTNARHRDSRIAYAAAFPTTAGQWTEVRIPFSELEPTFRGQTLQAPPFDAGRIEEIGFLIADKQQGPFHLSVDWIKAEQ